MMGKRLYGLECVGVLRDSQVEVSMYIWMYGSKAQERRPD